jgi:asparagine synthase (glutamine-hydrolysing)
MLSENQRVAITFNGEIYNHVEVRAQLEGRGHCFRSRSDTEVFLRAYLEWGERVFDRLIGWWAAAILDRDRDAILLSRDRLGKAPLYIRQSSSGIFWSSEIAPLLALTGPAAAHVPAVDDFVLSGFRDLDGTTFYEGIQSFPAASWAWVRRGNLGPAHRYWTLPSGRWTAGEIGPDEAALRVRSTVMAATELRLHADVPIAVQLSGGLDSSVLLACAALSGRRVQAVTVSFSSADANEDVYASAAASRYAARVDHEFIRPEEDINFSGVPRFLQSMGEPVHSPNQLASRVAWETLRQKGYKAVLYGAGGDEVFAGYYADYFASQVRSQLAQGDIRGALSNVWSLSERSRTPLDIARRLGILLPGGTALFRYLQRGIPPSRRIYTRQVRPHAPSLPSNIEDKLCALMGDMRMNYWLRVDNQNSMQVPIELRSPFLDHRVVELAFALPTAYLIRDGWMKWILRRAFERELPASVVWRKVKMGFPFPLRQWLSRHLGDVQSTLLQAEAPGIVYSRVESALEANIDRDPAFVWRAAAYALWWRERNACANP